MFAQEQAGKATSSAGLSIPGAAEWWTEAVKAPEIIRPSLLGLDGQPVEVIRPTTAGATNGTAVGAGAAPASADGSSSGGTTAAVVIVVLLLLVAVGFAARAHLAPRKAPVGADCIESAHAGCPPHSEPTAIATCEQSRLGDCARGLCTGLPGLVCITAVAVAKRQRCDLLKRKTGQKCGFLARAPGLLLYHAVHVEAKPSFASTVSWGPGATPQLPDGPQNNTQAPTQQHARPTQKGYSPRAGQCCGGAAAAAARSIHPEVVRRRAAGSGVVAAGLVRDLEQHLEQPLVLLLPPDLPAHLQLIHRLERNLRHNVENLLPPVRRPCFGGVVVRARACQRQMTEKRRGGL